MRIALLITFCINCFNFLNAQDGISEGSLEAISTFNNISIHYDFTGDDNQNSEMVIRYKLSTEDNFKIAAPTMRAHPDLMIDGARLDMNFHAGSVMHLTPGGFYDIEIELIDPDGGSTIENTSIATKEIPQPSQANIKYVAPGNGGGSGSQSDPFLGMQEAVNNAQAGDLFIVTSGTYAPFELLTTGSTDNNISFVSEELHGAVIDGENTDRGIITLGAFDFGIRNVIIDGFLIRNGKWGIDAQNTQFITVRNNIIEAVDYGYVNRREGGIETDQYITNNEITGRSSWPGSSIPDERGIDIRGNNNVVSFNTISNFGDGISTDGPPYEVSFSLDIHNNDIKNAIDDHIEVDGVISNTRIYNNRCYNGRAGISLAPIFGGPVYVLRNELFNYENTGLKMNRGPSGIIVVNNTIVSENNATESPTGWQNTFYRNNVILASRYCFEMFGLVEGSNDDWDYGAYTSTRGGASGTEWFKWNDIRYATVTELVASGLLEANAIEVTFDDFENIALPEPYPVEYDASERDFSPKAGSSVIDNGEAIDHLNDPYVSDGMVDRGALEFGEELPVYGAVFDATSSSKNYVEEKWVDVYPNPFYNEINILTEVQKDLSVEIFNSQGLSAGLFSGSKQALESRISQLSSGVYFVKFFSKEKETSTSFKLIKMN